MSWGEKAERCKVIVQLCVIYTDLFVEVVLGWPAHHTKPVVLIGLIYMQREGPVDKVAIRRVLP